MDRLKNKTAIITGGTKGIGLAAAELFLDEGANVIICGRGGSGDGAALAAQLGENCRFFALNVSDYKNWEDCISYAIKEFGKLDILINNAGISTAENIAQATPESYDKIIDVNQKGVFYGMKLAIEAMKKNPASADFSHTCAIVNTASIDGVVGDPIYFAYAASKAAVEAMTKCAALYCGEQQLAIRVNAVAPGYIMTPMAAQDAAEKGMSLEQYEKEMAADHPIGHLGKAKDVAQAYLYLASDESSFVTGTTLMVDGGYTAK